MSDELLDTLQSVVQLTEEVRQRIIEEQLDRGSFLLLTEEDLKELGFPMGPRKRILAWILSTSSTNQARASVSASAIVGAGSSMDSDMPATVTLATSSTPTSTTANFKNFPVDELLAKYDKTAVNGAALVSSLKDGRYYTSRERQFFVKVIGRHLMKTCHVPDQPSKQEKIDMCQSVINLFPVLRHSVTGGIESLYDARAHTGHLESYIRGRRHRDPEIKTLWTHKTAKRLDLATPADTGAEERSLRERRPNASNKAELLALMEATRPERREWIAAHGPSITDILQKYPRFQDIAESVREEFSSINDTPEKTLRDEWQHYKPAILQLAADSPQTTHLMEELTDELDEDKKSFVAFKALIFLLPGRPKKGVKKPRLSAEARVQSFFLDYESSSVEEAVDDILASQGGGVRGKREPMQPLLFRSQGQYFILGDRTAIPVSDASCFTEAVEFLFATFFVFNVHYPQELKYLYCFVERMLDLPSSLQHSAILDDFQRKLQPYIAV